MVVVGIQNLNDGFRQVFLLHRLLVFALVKVRQIKGLKGLRVPDPQGVHHVVAISDDGDIIGNRQHRLVSLLDKMVSLSVPLGFHVAAEFYLRSVFRTADLKGISIL